VNGDDPGVLRRFDRPGLWLGLWLFGWGLCVVLSLIHPPSLDVDVPEGDKLGHFLAYGLLAAWAVWIFSARRAQVGAAFGLVALGIAMEFAQGAWTTDRMMDWRDALADAVGVAIGFWLARARAPGVLQNLEARWLPRPRRAR
jgi:VanZ family protein